MTHRKLKIGIIGCGEVTQIIHLPSFTYLSDKFEVAALCDISRQVLDELGRLHGIEARYLDYRDLLEKAEVDAVLIANPHFYHHEVAMAPIAAGKHVLVEKPMCITLEQADQLVEAAESAAVTVQVGYMRRYARAFIEARKEVQAMDGIRLARVQDIIGRNALINQHVTNVIRGTDIPDDVLAEGASRMAEHTAQAIGTGDEPFATCYALLLGLSSHDISAMRELLGSPHEVLHAAARGDGRFITATFDYGDYLCQFATGIDQIARFDAHIEIYSAAKLVRVEYDSPYVRNLPTRLVVTEATASQGARTTILNPSWEDPFVLEWQAFHENVMTGATPKTSPADAREDLRLFGSMMQQIRAAS